MIGEPKDPKVVPAGEVQFDSGSAPQADSLEATLAGAQSLGSSSSWRVENMNFLAEQVWPVVENTYRTTEMSGKMVTDQSSSFPTPPLLKRVLPYWAFLRLHSKNKALAIFHTKGNELTPSLMKPLFDEVYGADMREAGLYEAIGLDGTVPIPLEDIVPYFPELENVLELESRVVPVTENPYFTLLSYPIEVRPLWAGALRELQAKGVSGKWREGFLNMLTTRDILVYAKKVNELTRVKDYFELLKGGSEKTK